MRIIGIIGVALLAFVASCWVTRGEVDDKIAQFEPTATADTAEPLDTGLN